VAHTIKGKKGLLARIRRIKGQAGALEKTLETDTACVAILQQTAAIRGAVNGLMTEILEGHIRDHLGPEAVVAEQREEDMEQVISVLRSYLK
jgi:DNA-binding FrmR family transcriptional regulator